MNNILHHDFAQVTVRGPFGSPVTISRELFNQIVDAYDALRVAGKWDFQPNYIEPDEETGEVGGRWSWGFTFNEDEYITGYCGIPFRALEDDYPELHKSWARFSSSAIWTLGKELMARAGIDPMADPRP